MINSNYTSDPSVTEGSLLKRVAVFLEDGEFDRADEYCERVLDMNVENGDAYLYKLLAKLQLKSEADLETLSAPFDGEPCYAKIMRFGSEELKRKIEKINCGIVSRIEEQKKAEMLDKARSAANSNSISELTSSYITFANLGDRENAEICKQRIESIYDSCYNDLYLVAKEKEQEINDRQYQNSTDVIERDGYDQYINENKGKKVFDYSTLVAITVAVIGYALVFTSSANYLSLAGLSFRTVLRVIFTRIVPGVPLSTFSGFISFTIAKKLVKKQRANLIEDIGTAAERAREINEKINSAQSEAFQLKRELDEKLEQLRKLNDDYDLFVAEKEKFEKN